MRPHLAAGAGGGGQIKAGMEAALKHFAFLTSQNMAKDAIAADQAPVQIPIEDPTKDEL